MAQELVTFGDIISSIRETLGIQSSDTNATNKIKRIINQVYLDEIVPFKQWWWLKKTIQIVHAPAYITGTAECTEGSAVVTFTSPGTVIGYKFSVDGSSQVYTIADQDAEELTLSAPFQEESNATASFKIWRDRIDLPLGAKETIEIWHNERPRPLEAVGPQEFRKLEAAEPKLEGFPVFYSTSDFYDPTSGDDEFEVDRYRQTQIYPSINSSSVILNIDYVQEADPLDDLADEPLMPVCDRIMLFYGALALAYSSLNRNEDMHDRYQQRFQVRLSRAAGDRDEGQDTPKLSPKSSYVNSIRRSGLKRRSW